MKKKPTSQSAFFNPRSLFGFALCCIGLALAIFALSGFTVASEPAPASAPVSAAAPQLTKGVTPVVTGSLRDMPVIPPSLAPGHHHVEPMTPAPPTEGAGVDTALQTTPGPIYSAPAPTGLSWDGVGVGLAGFSPGSNPPDVEGRVGATQYMQWNNTSFAVFNKNTGALLYGLWAPSSWSRICDTGIFTQVKIGTSRSV